MRMLKRLSVLIFIVLLSALCCINASAATSGYFTYEIENNQAIITGLNTAAKGDVAVPGRLGGNYVVEIGENAFKDGVLITCVTVPDGVNLIADTAFTGCAALKGIVVSADNTEYSDVDGVLFNKDKSVLIKYPAHFGGDTFTVNENVTDINSNAFSECNNLKKLTVLNAGCVIYDSEFTIDSDVIICAPKDSSAHLYAQKYGKKFEIYCLHTDTKEVGYTAPSCVNPGYTEGVYCNNCEAFIDGHVEISSIGHKWNDGEIKSASTCATKGYIKYTCLNDASHTYSESLNLNSDNHEGGTYISKQKNATCTVKGYTGDVCCVGCNKVINSGSSIKALGHIIKSRNSNKNGTHTGVCTRENCNYSETDSCNYNDWSTTKNPTCTANGSKQRKCKICSYVNIKAIDKLGHSAAETVVENKVNSSCVKKGKYDEVVHCTRCKNQISRKTKETALKKHTYKRTVSKTATTSADGKITYKCTCGSSYSEKIYKISSVALSCTYYTYNGKNRTPQLTVKNSKGKILVKNEDYKVAIPTQRKSIGKYTVKVEFTGSYSGSKNLYFYILPAQVKNLKVSSYTASSVSLKWSKVSGASGYKVYRYDSSKKSYVLTGTTSSSKFTVSKLKNSTTYKFKVIAYGKNKDGKSFDSKSYATLTAKTCTASLNLRLATTAKGRATIAWNDVKGETGYQVFFASKKNGEYKKISNYKPGTVKVYKTGLVSGKTYYFKVRTYIKSDNGYIYSLFSAVKSIKIK